MGGYDSLSPGSKSVLILSVAYYLKSFSNFYDDPLKKHPQELKEKYSKLPFLTQISSRLIEEAEKLKFEDYQTGDNTVLDNDFLKIGFGYHDDLYHLLLLKSFVLQFETDLKLESDLDYFQSNLDPLSVLPTLVALFLEKYANFQDRDFAYRAYEKLAFTFLKDYTNSNKLFKTKEQDIILNEDMVVSSWLKFSRIQLKSYDSDAVSTKIEELRAKGNQYHKDKLYTDAAISYTEGLKINPNSYHLLSNRGAIYSVLNLGESAVTDLRKAVNLQPSSVSAWARLAFNCLYTGRAIESFTCYNNALLASFGLIFPLHLKNKDDELKRNYREHTLNQLNKKFVKKLCDGMLLARSRAETQDYPSKYLDDLVDPAVKEILEKHAASPKVAPVATEAASADPPPPAASNSETRGASTTSNTTQTQIPNFSNVFTSLGDNGAPDFQQIFNTFQQEINTQNGNGNNANTGNPGISIISNIVGSFLNGMSPQQTNANTTAPAPTNTAQRGNSNENVEMGEADDADPDIDLDEIIQDENVGQNQTTSNNNATPNVIVTSFSGPDMPTEVRDHISRFAGGFFNLFGDARGGQAQAANATQEQDNRNSGTGAGAGTGASGNAGSNEDSMENDLD